MYSSRKNEKYRPQAFWPWVIALAIGALSLSCSGGYEQGDCDPGYLDVNGKCELAVGQACETGGDCLANICEKQTDQSGFCTIKCEYDENCPTGFFCNYAENKHCFPGKRPPPCQADSDCDACQSCIDGYCFVIPNCITCSTDEQCQTCQRCDQGECISVAGCQKCQSELDCDPCDICTDDGICQKYSGCILCAVDNDCPGCMYCDRGACEDIQGCGGDACFNDNDCPPRTKCLDNALLAKRTCLPVNLPFGSNCERGGDPTCADGLCINEPGGEFTCSSACETDDECIDFTVCRPDQECLWACRSPDAAPPGSACLSDYDCPPDRVCGLVADEANGQWDSRCIVPRICVGLPGETCQVQSGNRCTTSICTLSGFCSPVCASDLDCPVGFLCDLLTFDLPNEVPATFWGCEPQESVSSDVGEACPAGNQDCKSDLCLANPPDGPTQYCSQNCIPGEADCPDRFECRASPLEPEINLCQPSLIGGECQNDSGCSDGKICTLGPANDSTVCADSISEGALPGEICGQDLPCANSLCLSSGICSAICDNSADCPEDLKCEYIEVYGPTGSRAFASMCSGDAGSQAECKVDSDCQAPEVCGLLLNQRGSGLDGRCRPPGNPSGPGEACSSGADCVNGFCPLTGICTNLCLSDSDCGETYYCDIIDVSLWPSRAFQLSGCLEIVLSELGQACPNSDEDCIAGLVCFAPPLGGDHYCSRVCEDNEDCSDGENMFCLDDGNGTLYCQSL